MSEIVHGCPKVNNPDGKNVGLWPHVRNFATTYNPCHGLRQLTTMALKTLVKISNVTNLSDARYCAGMGVDMLGFSMDTDSPDYVEPKKFAEIRGWLAGVQIVGETRSTDPEAIEQLLEMYQPDLLQVDEAALLPYLSTLGTSDKELRFILRVDVAQLTLDQLDTLLQTGAANADYVLLESNGPVNMEDELKTLLQRRSTRYSILLGTGISAENVHALLAELSSVRGIALSGGIEEQPGNKEFGELMDILEAIEED